MTGWIIAGAVVLLIWLIGRIPLGAGVSRTREEGNRIWLQLGPASITLYPRPKKTPTKPAKEKKSKPAKEKKPKKEGKPESPLPGSRSSHWCGGFFPWLWRRQGASGASCVSMCWSWT